MYSCSVTVTLIRCPLKNYDDDYTGGADQRDGGYDYKGEAVHTNGYPAGGHPQRQPPTPAWNQQPQGGQLHLKKSMHALGQH